MLRNQMINIFEAMWPTLIISMVIIISMRVVYLFKNKKEIVLYRELVSLLFIIYVLCLFYVVTFQDVSWSSSNYVPFHEMFRYQFGSRLFIKNVIGNMLLFVPYGFFTAYFLKLEKPKVVIILSLLVSVTIETTQLLIGRVFDIDDIILNFVGGILGFYVYHLLDKINHKLPNILKKPIIYNIIMIGLLILVIGYLIGLIELGV